MWSGTAHMPSYEHSWAPSSTATTSSRRGKNVSEANSSNSSSSNSSPSKHLNVAIGSTIGSRSTHPYQASASSSSSSTGGYSSSLIDRPSPSSSATSTSSSLRTPPDLLISASTLASTLSGPAKGYYQASGKPRELDTISRTTATKKAGSSAPARHLTVAQLESRLKLLAKATESRIMSDALPSPPASPKHKRAGGSSQSNDHGDSRGSKKRRASNDFAASHPAPDTQRLRLTTSPPSSASEAHYPLLPLPRVREWTKEKYFETAIAYRHRGRELKHRGDRRLRESSAQLASPKNEALIASLEQTDALLLYTYGFWCEDQGSATCVAANWHSIYALLRYVYLRYEKGKVNALSGLCRLLEASILRHVSAHEMRMLHHRMGKVSSEDHASRAELTELSSQMTKVVGDQERSARLFVQARQSVLNLSNLTQQYPRLAHFCKASMQSSPWMTNDPSELATRVDPSETKGLSPSEAATSDCGWSWPLDSSTPFPMLVCFGRALLREAAREAKVDFTTESVFAKSSSS